MTAAASLAGLLLLTACTSGGEGPDGANDALERIRETETQSGERMSATIPSDLQMIPDDYRVPANQQGRLERLTYTTYESFLMRGPQSGAGEDRLGACALRIYG